MTNAETRDLSVLSDRELDSLVAERVMGGEQWAKDDWGCRHEWSTSWFGAGLVLEAMREQGWSWHLAQDPNQLGGRAVGMFHKVPTRTYESDDSLPRAVCIAALRALEAGA